MSTKLALLIAVMSVLAVGVCADMTADSPVKFPKEGALPAKYLPDLPARDGEEPEKGYYLFSSPERSREQIAKIQSEMPAGAFTLPRTDWKYLKRTRRTLTRGGDLHIMAVGDSIINDTMRSAWVEKLREAYPKAKITATVFVRGGGGCQHYNVEHRVDRFLIPRHPDLLIVGGISQASVEDIGEFIHQVRSGLPDVEILLTTGVFGTADPRVDAELAAAPYSGTGEYGKALKELAASEKCAYLDMTTPWAQYIRSSRLHPHLFYRDIVHANEFGEQILCKILTAYWTNKG